MSLGPQELPSIVSPRRITFALARLLPAMLSVAVCLGLMVALVAGIASSRKARSEDPADAPPTFSQAIDIVGQTFYQRIIRPRGPNVQAGYRNWIQVFSATTPLLLCGLAIAVAFRAGMLNIGAQGQYVAGAVAATAVGLYLPAQSSPMLIAATLLAAMLAGAAMGALAGVLDRWRNVPVVLGTLLLTFVAIGLLRYLLEGPMRLRNDDGTLGEPQSATLPEAAQLPEFFAGGQVQGIHLGFFLAIAAAAVIAFVLALTTFGFRLRAVGLNPLTSRFAGIHVNRVAIAAIALSGAVAGLAGAIQVAGLRPYFLSKDLATDAIGFTGIAVALLGRLSPVGVIVSALFFGVISRMFAELESSSLEIHRSTAQAVQGLLVLTILVVTSPTWSRMMRGMLGSKTAK